MDITGSLRRYKNKRICVALSGGGDSVALFCALRAAAGEYGITLSAVNVEHGIRGESSRADTEFVKGLCADAGVPLYCVCENVPALAKEWGKGVEEAARIVRYRAFLRILREDGADLVATAHHAGDNAESVLFNLFRGASLTGAGGIRDFVPAEELAAAFAPAEGAEAANLRGKGIIRPLLGIGKAEIAAYLREKALAWREDESNTDAAYARNFLRSAVLAPARERFPALDKALYAFSRSARADDEYLYSLARQYFAEGDVCFVTADAPRPLFLRACVLALRRFGVEKDYTQENLNALYALARGENGKAADLPRGILARREYGKIAFYRGAPPAAAPEYPFGEGEFAFGEFCVRIVRRGSSGFKQAAPGVSSGGGVLYVDAARLPENCVLRTRKEGDVFRKFGSGTKKLKEFFIDRKVPQRLRDRIPLIACGSEVFAVCGIEISERAKVGIDSDVYTIELTDKGERFQCIRT